MPVRSQFDPGDDGEDEFREALKFWCATQAMQAIISKRGLMEDEISKLKDDEVLKGYEDHIDNLIFDSFEIAHEMIDFGYGESEPERKRRERFAKKIADKKKLATP